MKNVYDIRYEKNLIYILPGEEKASVQVSSEKIYEQTAVILHLYYLDTLSIYWKYIDNIPEKISVFVISSQMEVLEEVRNHIVSSGRCNTHYIQKENRGRDISAFLVIGSDIIKKYKYVCFLHDKKEHNERLKKDTDLWIENLWGNLLGSPGYIDQILSLFEEKKELGILAPPDPIGDHFRTWYGLGWHGSFSVTKRLAEELHLQADISMDKPPVTIGTALWFKSAALHKLFEKKWSYADFNDRNLGNAEYLSYGIERIFAYVAQNAGYDTGTCMTVSYAEKQTNYLQYAAGRIFAESRNFFPIASVYDMECCKRNMKRITDFAEKNSNLYLYGAGEMGRFCFYILKSKNLSAKGYLVSGDCGDYAVNGLPVFSIKEMDRLSVGAVVITVFDEKIKKDMADNLEKRGFYNFIKFWN